MNRQSITAEVCGYIRSHRDQELGASFDIIIPWGNTSQIHVRVERMTGRCINLNTDLEMMIIEPRILDAAFTEKSGTPQTKGARNMEERA